MKATDHANKVRCLTITVGVLMSIHSNVMGSSEIKTVQNIEDDECLETHSTYNSQNIQQIEHDPYSYR